MLPVASILVSYSEKFLYHVSNFSIDFTDREPGNHPYNNMCALIVDDHDSQFQHISTQ